MSSIEFQTIQHIQHDANLSKKLKWKMKKYVTFIYLSLFIFLFLQEDYNRLLTKYAEAENTIDRLRLEAKVGFTDSVYSFVLFFPLHLKADMNSVLYSRSYQQACLPSPSALMSTRVIFRLLRLSQHYLNAESLLWPP